MPRISSSLNFLQLGICMTVSKKIWISVMRLESWCVVLSYFIQELTSSCMSWSMQVTDRLSIIHGPVKAHALVEIAAYELGKGDKCVERVEALFNRFVFIFPGSWSIDTKTSKEVCDCDSYYLR